MTSPRLLPILLAAASTLVPVRSAQACAACRNPALPTANASAGPLPGGSLRTGLLLSGTAVRVIHSAGCVDTNDCDEVPVQPEYLHDQRIYPFETRLAAEYGLSDTFGFELQVPFRVVVARIDFTTPEGDHYEPLDADVHHRNETLAGIADPLLMGRVGGLWNQVYFAARLGVTIPLGHTEPDPFQLGDVGEEHQHIQFGTGTFDPTVSVEASRRFDKVTLRGFTQTAAALYENHHGFRAPFRIQGGLNGDFLLGAGWTVGVGAGTFHEAAERWQGVVRQDASLGRTEIYGEASVGHAWEKTQLGLIARAPLYRYIVSGSEDLGEYRSPVAVQIALTRLWELQPQ